MKLEECVKVKLHFVEESSYTLDHDIYTSSKIGERSETPVCFSTRDLAESYRIILANEKTRKGYVNRSGNEMHSKNDSVTKISITSRSVLKDSIVSMNNKQYYCDTEQNKMYEIYDKIEKIQR